MHKVDTEDFMQNLRAADELDRNNFHHSTYVIKSKQSVKLPTVLELRQIADATSEFDDNEEIQEEKEDAQYHREHPQADFEMWNPTRLEVELKKVNMSSQVLLSTKRSRGEQLAFTILGGGKFFGRIEQNQQGKEGSVLEIESEPLVRNSRGSP
jgi:hypothetical protein